MYTVHDQRTSGGRGSPDGEPLLLSTEERKRCQYILRRLVLVIPVLIGVSIVVFWMIRAIPGDPARVIAGEAATDETLERYS